MKITWQEVSSLKKKAENVKLFVVSNSYEYDADNHVEDDYEQAIIDEATAQIRAHREEKFRTALARYIAEQGG